MQYKVVSGPKAVEGNKASSATTAFESIINSNAVGGWKYHSMETIVVVPKGGCLKKVQQPVSMYMLIFEKED